MYFSPIYRHPEKDITMEGVYNIDNQIAKIAKEHKIITDYVVTFNKSLKTRDKEFFKGIATFFNFLEKDLLHHFRFEEVVIFPAAIAGETTYGNTLMVMFLQKEHGMLENQLQILGTEIKNIKTSHEKLTNEMIERIRIFFEALKDHAKRELTDLYPIIDANAKSKSLVEVYIEEMKNI